MKILHYLFGMPEAKGGGLIKYVLDLSAEQAKENEVVLLSPGPIAFSRGNRNKVSIKRVNYYGHHIHYVINNPLPVPMANGIKDIEWFTQQCDINIYINFLQSVSPDIIHVHSLMGIHKEFFVACRRLRIPIVFTTHDFFGICPKMDLYARDHVCTDIGSDCFRCCENAFSEKFLVLQQSDFFRLYKKYRPFSGITHTEFYKRTLGKSEVLPFGREGENYEHQEVVAESDSELKDYTILLNYYREMFKCVDYFLFNSSITQDIYTRVLPGINGEILHVSTSSISDQRIIRKCNNVLRLGFLGGDVPFKGGKRFINIVNTLYEEGFHNIELHTYGLTTDLNYPFLHIHPAYSSSEIDNVYDSIDVVVMPAFAYETFSLVGLEALSRGVPAIVTDRIGFKDIISQYDATGNSIGMVVKDDDNALKEAIKMVAVNLEIVNKWNANIANIDYSFDYQEHVAKVRALYEKVINTAIRV